MLINFTKMHGLGNDFVVIDAINQDVHLTTKNIQFLANRNMGIGFDQLLLIEKTQLEAADFHYTIYNADGSHVQQCGNGARCFATFVRDEGLTDKKEIPVSTLAGLITLTIEDDEQVTVNMGDANLEPKALPFLPNAVKNIFKTSIHGYTFPLEEASINEQPISFSIVSMGNPHAVIIVDDVASLEIEPIARAFQTSEAFPESVNVGFMEVVSKDEIKLRVYERGSGETLACGSGACAAVVTGINQGLLNQDVNATLTGGILSIHWSGKGNPVMMTGSTTSVFKGTFEI